MLLAGTATSAAAAIDLGNLVVSRLTYTGTASTVVVGQTLPTGGKAVADGSYPNVYQNLSVDSNFGVTAAISLDGYTVAANHQSAVKAGSQTISGVVSSFSSKSEGALNLSTDGKSLTIAGYIAPVNALDVSNSNTPNHVDPTNPDAQTFQRGIAEISATGNVQVTGFNGYTGDNVRAVVKTGAGYYAVGNSNNGSKTADNVTSTDGVQLVTPGVGGDTAKVGSFSITQLGYAADKPGKDDNLRGLTVFNNTVFATKGSGGNGIDSIYQIGAAGTLPTGTGNAVTLLPGFPSGLAKTNDANFYPFGIWFANATTLYVADEGDGKQADAGSYPNAGLSKWTLANGSWSRDYVLQAGLQLGITYGVDGLPTSLDPATAGLRNITGQTNADGTVTIFGVTSTVSGNVEPGIDPNRLVAITDLLSATTSPSGEQFSVLQTANYGDVLRGVSLAPGVPEPALWAMLITGFGLVGGGLRRRRRFAAA